MAEPINLSQPPIGDKDGRYQVLAESKPSGQRNRQIWYRQTKRKANALKKQLRALGYKQVEVWDTLDNSISNLFRF